MSFWAPAESAKPLSPPHSAWPPRPLDLRTAVITVDPARRLRDALGLPRLGGKPTRIDARRLRAAGLDPALKLSAMVLDVKGEWDAMVAEHVADPAIRQHILDNAFYQSLSTQFAGSDAYAALEHFTIFTARAISISRSSILRPPRKPLSSCRRRRA